MSKTGVRLLAVGLDQHGRRLDNFLVTELKGAPKSFIYRIIRRGEVRVNGARSRPDTKLVAADVIRIPPMFDEEEQSRPISAANLELIRNAVLYENDSVLVLNKPAGLAVHGGTGLHFGVVDIVRQLRSASPGIELVHRLDRETSGCLIFAKDYPSLRSQQAQLNKPDSQKTYVCLLQGQLNEAEVAVNSALQTKRHGGEKRTVVETAGKSAATVFRTLETFDDLTLAHATITTGRTHQIRVHAASIGHPIVGDDKYGDTERNAESRKTGLRRMFLHAAAVTIRPAASAAAMTITAPLPDELAAFLAVLRCR